ncbi:MAG: peptide chain release factor N(5)-glutamine methyltransferase [Blautia sp.]|nr:peptide chain release factor N(5)-glutamine methyltransferase [Blautia sp.]
MNKNYQQTYEWGVGQLSEAGIAEAQLEARLLLEYVCGTDRNTLLVHGEREVSAEETGRYETCISRRLKHEPLQYITGWQDFMGLTFSVNEHVLIPRQDTEILVEEAMRYLHDGMRILDMCTGSGCILLSLLYYSNDCIGLGVDISKEALQVAEDNARKLGRDRKALNAAFLQGDLFEGLEGAALPKAENGGLGDGGTYPTKFEMMISNPPYIRSDVIETLMPEVREYEPLTALDGREDGLYFYRRIIPQAGKYLTGGGRLFLEIGYDQGEAVQTLMESAGFIEVEVVKDYGGLDRVVHGVWV